MGTGYFLSVISFIIIYFIQVKIDSGIAPNIGWQVLAYIIITAAEVMIYQTGLEYAYTQAPASMKSTIMSFWLLTIAFGNILVSEVNSNIASGGLFSKLTGAQYFLFFTILMAVVSLIYILVSRTFKENTVTQNNV
jgi:POT family proton-dependent oligopeptide transporter